MVTSTHELLIRLGYKLVDDASNSDGRLTYNHNDDATREFIIVSLAKDLRSIGWETHPEVLRAFRHIESSGEVIQIEPGGADTAGHFLHHMREG
jgi:hypothetical protein